MSYYKRALKSSDPRFSRILGKLGYGRRDMQAAPAAAPAVPVEVPAAVTSAEVHVAKELFHEGHDDLTSMRAEYERIFMRKPYWGWDIDMLRDKIAEAKGAE